MRGEGPIVIHYFVLLCTRALLSHSVLYFPFPLYGLMCTCVSLAVDDTRATTLSLSDQFENTSLVTIETSGTHKQTANIAEMQTVQNSSSLEQKSELFFRRTSPGAGWHAVTAVTLMNVTARTCRSNTVTKRALHASLYSEVLATGCRAASCSCKYVDGVPASTESACCRPRDSEGTGASVDTEADDDDATSRCELRNSVSVCRGPVNEDTRRCRSSWGGAAAETTVDVLTEPDRAS